jgi:hypothetical protein
MKTSWIATGPLLVLMLLAGCATIPTGPSVMVLPGPNKPFEVFQAEDARCRDWALSRIGQSPQETADRNVASGAAVGAAVGAGLGAVIGAGSGDAASGAAVGQQCMYASGNIIPGVRSDGPSRRLPPPPPPAGWRMGPSDD